MELLAPAGSYEALVAAVQSGADAVYLGGAKFGARQSAKNFSEAEMKKWVDYCHLYGVLVFVTVNTLIKDSETDEFREYITFLNSISVDALIVQDLGAFSIIRSCIPGMQVHASTQMTASSLEDVLFLEKLGFSRVVLSRELSSAQIKYICDNCNCETEVFVHGALCMSYSGQCLFSSMIGGRSGNRGRCAQPCRLPYKLVEGNEIVKNGFLLSPRDLCLAGRLDKLRNAGVTSLKIEGRLKRAEYVSTVVGIYRDLVDSYRKASASDIKQLSDAFGRGFTAGLFGGECGRKMMNFENSSNAAGNVFTPEAISRCRENANFRKINVFIHGIAKIGKPIEVIMYDNDGNCVTVCGSVECEKAIKSPTGEERFKTALTKLGSTPYECENITVEIDSDAVVGISEINNVRRMACDALTEKRIYRPEKSSQPLYELRNTSSKCFKRPEIICAVSTSAQAKIAKKLGIDKIICSKNISAGNVIEKFPEISSEKYTAESENVYVSSPGQLLSVQGKTVYGSNRLNISNRYSAEFYSNYMDYAVLSPELKIGEIKSIISNTALNCGIIAYGYLDLMICGNCPVKAAGLCQNKKQKYHLADRKGEKFALLCDDNCRMRILNSKPVYIADKWDDFSSVGLDFIVLSFTTEKDAECEFIIKNYKKALSGQKAEALPENSFTRGHFYRGVL